MEGGPFRPSPPPPLTLERPKKPSINRVNLIQNIPRLDITLQVARISGFITLGNAVSELIF